MYKYLAMGPAAELAALIVYRLLSVPNRVTMHPQPRSTGVEWKPGYSRHVPWAAFFSIFTFILCCLALGIVLWHSEGKDISTWPSASHPIAVSVLLSLIVSIGNLCLLITLRRGYEISWWLRAIKGAELRTLQFDLDVQQSIGAIFSRRPALNEFALAAVLSLVVSILDGPLIQRASTVGTKVHAPMDINASVKVLNTSLPANFSSFGIPPDFFTPLFSNISLAYSNRESIQLPVDGCNENVTCFFNLPAPGLDVSCTQMNLSYDFLQLGSASLTNNNYTTFNVSLVFADGRLDLDYSTINISALYKPDAACSGNFIQRNCTLRLATVRYPVTVSNGTATIEKWRLGQNDTLKISTFPIGRDITWTGSVGAASLLTMLGGVAFLLGELYTGFANLRLKIQTATPYILTNSGQSSSNYLASDISTYGNCTMVWEDPTTDIVNTARELMFRSGIAYANTNASAVALQELQVQKIKTAAAYYSHYEYLGITIGCMVLEVLVILFLLWGWNRLGRHVSLDAFEVARALGAPLLQGSSSNSHIKDALKSLQHTKLRYGEILPESTVSLIDAGEGQRPERRISHKYGDDERNFEEGLSSKLKKLKNYRRFS